MAQDTAQIRIAPAGDIYVAPVGTTAPADEVAAWPAGWVNLGLATEDGVTLTDSKTMTEIRSWQQFYVSRRTVNARDFALRFVLQQWNKANVSLAFGGTTTTTPSAGHNKVVPPSPSFIDYRAVGIEWTDGSLHYRLIMPKALNSDNVESMLRRSEESRLPITMGLVGVAGQDPWFMLTDDPAFA